jgi:uncharacterized membrane protein YdjX (TVP38/TMEM64 family)
MQKIFLRTILVGVFLIIVAFIWYFSIFQYVSLSFLQEKMVYLRHIVEKQYATALMIYTIFFGVIVACTIPAVGPLTLLGGYLFGALVGTCASLIALACGISISFLVIRYLLSSFLPARWEHRRDIFAKRIHEYGAWYIFTLNVVTVVPLVVINTLAALSDISLFKFVSASVVGSFPMIAMYAFAGRKFAEISSIGEIFSPSFIGILVLLTVLSCIPMIIKRITNVSIDDV